MYEEESILMCKPHMLGYQIGTLCRECQREVYEEGKEAFLKILRRVHRSNARWKNTSWGRFQEKYREMHGKYWQRKSRKTTLPTNHKRE